MTENLKEIENDILNLFIKVNVDFGNDSVLAKLVSIIYLSPEEISLEELMKKTGYSPATISNKTRMLADHGMIKKVSKPGTKRSFYYMDKDLKKTFSSMMGKILEIKVMPIKETLPGLIDRYKKNMLKTDNQAKKKLEIIENHLKNVEKIEESLKIFITSLKD